MKRERTKEGIVSQEGNMPFLL